MFDEPAPPEERERVLVVRVGVARQAGVAEAAGMV
jgi:hypothetical protein